MNKFATVILSSLFVAMPCIGEPIEEIGVPTALQPSDGLRKSVQVNGFEATDKIRIASGECLNPAVVPLKALARIKEVTRVVGGVETPDGRRPKRLFTLTNDGGLRQKDAFVSVQLDLQAYNPGKANLWLFFYTKTNVYAQAAQIECRVVE